MRNVLCEISERCGNSRLVVYSGNVGWVRCVLNSRVDEWVVLVGSGWLIMYDSRPTLELGLHFGAFQSWVKYRTNSSTVLHYLL